MSDAPSLEQRYRLAADRTGPRLATLMPGLAVRGYWLSNQHYFFEKERFEPRLGQVIAEPAIADVKRRRVDLVMTLDEVVATLSSCGADAPDLHAVAAARYDMRNRQTFSLTLPGRRYEIDLGQRRLTAVEVISTAGLLHAPDDRLACFVRDADLWLVDRESGTERRLTHDGAPNFRYGQSPGLGEGDAGQAMPMAAWTPDGQWLFTHRIDERDLPVLHLVENVPESGLLPVLHNLRYSLPSSPMPTLVYLAIHIATGRVVTFDSHPGSIWGGSPFLRMQIWFERSNRAYFIRTDRYCRRVELVRLDPETGAADTLFGEDVDDGYIDLNPTISGAPNVRVLEDDGKIIFYSERDGWGHLYLLDLATGAQCSRITEGPWQVRSIVSVDEEKGDILFLAAGLEPGRDPGERALCRVKMNGSGFDILVSDAADIAVASLPPPCLMTGRPGRTVQASAGMSPDRHHVVLARQSVERGNRVEILDLRSGNIQPLFAAVPNEAEIAPQPFTVCGADGETALHGVMYLPSHFDCRKAYPIVDYVYPGPQIPWRPRAYSSMRATPAIALAELGFVTIMLDTRGTPWGSRKFRHAGYPHLVEPQLADHAAAIRQLAEVHAFIDGTRAGIFGYSGGGHAAARALFDHGDVFSVGVSVCGDHDNQRYTACWSDKYCGPVEEAGWARHASATTAHKLSGKLLLVSGDMDANVHVSQTLRLADALIRANRDFDLLIVPGAGHDVLFHGYTQRRVWDYFVRHLSHEEPPFDVDLAFTKAEKARFEDLLLQEMLQ